MLHFEICSSLRAKAGMEAKQERGDRNSAVLVLPDPLPPSSQETSIPVPKSHMATLVGIHCIKNGKLQYRLCLNQLSRL